MAELKRWLMQPAKMDYLSKDIQEVFLVEAKC